MKKHKYPCDIKPYTCPFEDFDCCTHCNLKLSDLNMEDYDPDYLSEIAEETVDLREIRQLAREDHKSLHFNDSYERY